MLVWPSPNTIFIISLLNQEPIRISKLHLFSSVRHLPIVSIQVQQHCWDAGMFYHPLAQRSHQLPCMRYLIVNTFSSPISFFFIQWLSIVFHSLRSDHTGFSMLISCHSFLPHNFLYSSHSRQLAIPGRLMLFYIFSPWLILFPRSWVLVLL